VKRLLSILRNSVVLVGLGGSLAVAASPTKLEFEDLPRLVQEKNGNVEGARLSVESQEKRTGYLFRSYLPTLKTEVGGEAFQSNPLGAKSQPFGGIEARINLFRGGRDSLEETIREERVQVSDAEKQQTFFEELTRARKAYWVTVYQKEVLQILREALELNTKNRAAAEKRIRSGIATETDRIEFEINHVQLEQDTARMELALANAERDLSAILGMAPDTRFETVSQAPHVHFDDLLALQSDFDAHRDVVQLRASGAVFEQQKRQLYRWWTPSVDVFGAYLLHTQRERDPALLADRYETVGGVMLTLELFDGLQSKVDGSAAGLRADALDSRAGQRRRELEARLQSAKAELKLNHNLIHAGEVNLELGKDYFTRSLGEYARGVKNSPDVLGATQKYVEYKRRYAELRRDYHLAHSDLLGVIGK